MPFAASSFIYSLSSQVRMPASEPVSDRQERSHLNYYNRQLQWKRNTNYIIT